MTASYILFFLLLAAGLLLKSNKGVLYLFAVLFSITNSLRDISTPDTDFYVFIFSDIDLIGGRGFGFLSSEPGFQVLSQIIKLIFYNSTFYLFICSFIPNLIYAHIIWFLSEKYESVNNVLLYFILYMSFMGFFYSAIVLRQGIAMAILHYIYVEHLLFKKRRSIKNWLFIFLLFLIAFSFHYSTILGVIPILVLLSNKIFEKKTYKTILTFCGVFLFLGLSATFVSSAAPGIFSMLGYDSLFIRYDYYSKDTEQLISTVPFRLLFQLIIAFVLLRIPSQHNNLFYKLYNVFFIGIIISCLFASIAQIARLADHFLISGILLQFLYDLIIYKKSRKGRPLLIFSILLYFIFFVRV